MIRYLLLSCLVFMYLVPSNMGTQKGLHVTLLLFQQFSMAIQGVSLPVIQSKFLSGGHFRGTNTLADENNLYQITVSRFPPVLTWGHFMFLFEQRGHILLAAESAQRGNF